MSSRVRGGQIAAYLYFAIVVCIFIWLFMLRWEYFKFSLVPARVTNTKHQNKYKTLLLWNEFGNSTWYNPADTITMTCPHATCVLTNQRDYLPQVDMFDAVLFYTVNNLAEVPQTRASQQFYVFVLLESPAYTKHDLSAEGDFYNLTMTYRLDSDVIWSYAKIVDKQLKSIVAPTLRPTWRALDTTWTQTDENLKAIIRNKSKLAAWFVSHCKTASKREQLAEELQHYIPIDIYGSCGQLTCSRDKHEACQQLLDKEYKFYLSFENSLCMDYVTEKFFDALQHNVVPVVFGGANYTNIAPPHSYIDARSFSNAAQLAAHLRHLDSSSNEYARYFWWKRYYKLLVPTPYCDLCDHISSSLSQHRTQSYTNIKGFWREDRDGQNACIEKSEYFNQKITNAEIYN